MTAGDQGGGGLPAAGWYADTANPVQERLWTGERWTNFIRPPDAGRVEAVPAGWYPDTGHPGFERLWSGEMWTEEIRRAAPSFGAPPVARTGAVPGQAAAPLGAAGVGQVPGAPLQPIIRVAGSYSDGKAPDRLGGLATWLTISFGVGIVAAIVELIANQRYISLESDLIGGGLTTLSHAESVTHTTEVANTIALLVGLVTGILFLVWFYRAYRNLARVGITDLRYGLGWAIGGWFIPIFNLFRQKAIANDIWKGSASAGTIGIARWRQIPLPGLINWWWGIWILSGLSGAWGRFRIEHVDSHVVRNSAGFDSVVSTTYTTLGAERTALWVTQVGLLASIVAAVLAILVVRDITRMQDEYFHGQVPEQDMMLR